MENQSYAQLQAVSNSIMYLRVTLRYSDSDYTGMND